MSTEKHQKNEQLIFIVSFSIASSTFNVLPIFSDYNKLLISGLLGASGAFLGMLLYKKVANQSNVVKYGSLSACIILILTAALSIKRYHQKRELTENNKILEQIIHTFSSSVLKDINARPLDTTAIKPPVLTKAEYAKLITCEICGYKALHPDSAFCFYCRAEPFEHIGYKHDNKREWLKEQQSMWFFPDDSTNKVDFYSPKEDYGYRKDPNWKPIVTEVEVLEFWNFK